MKTETFSGTIENAYGNKLPESVPFSGSFDSYENPAEVKSAGDWPSESDIVEMVNAKRKATERAKATQKALDAKSEALKAAGQPASVYNLYKKLDASTPEGQRENLIKSILKANPRFTRERAEKMAASMIEAE
jgi:hypothetical protein